MKRWVLRPLLKESADCGALRCGGRAFHSSGAIEQKARSPMVRNLVFTGLRRLVFEERRLRVEGCRESSSFRQEGALPWMH